MRRSSLVVAVVMGILGTAVGVLWQDPHFAAVGQDAPWAGLTEEPTLVRKRPTPSIVPADAFAQNAESEPSPTPVRAVEGDALFPEPDAVLPSSRRLDGSLELPAIDAVAHAAPLPNLLVLLDGASVRVVSGSKAVTMLNAAHNQPLPKNLLMIQCDEFNLAEAVDVGHPLQFSGRVTVKALDFEATAGKLTKTGTRFLLEAEGDEPVRLSRTGPDDQFTLSAKRIEFDSARNEVKAGSASVVHALPADVDRADSGRAEALPETNLVPDLEPK